MVTGWLLSGNTVTRPASASTPSTGPVMLAMGLMRSRRRTARNVTSDARYREVGLTTSPMLMSLALMGRLSRVSWLLETQVTVRTVPPGTAMSI